MHTIILPWPPRETSPNARCHWRTKAYAAKNYRAQCFALAHKQGAGKFFDDGMPVHILARLLFVPTSRRRFDLDNALAAMKSGLDALAHAVGLDDSKWSFHIGKADFTAVHPSAQEDAAHIMGCAKPFVKVELQACP